MSTFNQVDPYSFQSIRKQIFPYLEPALKKLLDQINRKEVVNQYQTKLAKKKIYDRCEQKFIQKQRLRKQLGDQYESSDSQDDVDYQFLGISKQNIKNHLRKYLTLKNFQVYESNKTYEQNKDEIIINNVNRTNILTQQQLIDAKKLNQIKQNDCEQQSKADIEIQFNPLLFLAAQIQKIYLKKINLKKK